MLLMMALSIMLSCSNDPVVTPPLIVTPPIPTTPMGIKIADDDYV